MICRRKYGRPNRRRPRRLPSGRLSPQKNQLRAFESISSADLDREDYTPTPIITEALFAGIPAVIGGLFKTGKSLIGVDAGVSISTGNPFLGSWTIPEPRGVLYFSGEGGPCVAQDYARRIAASKGICLGDATQLRWCFSVPRLENLNDLDDFCRELDGTAAEVVILDNLMLCLSGDDAGNVYKMGSVLGNVIRLCTERNVTPIFIHHFKRVRSTSDPFAPGELADLTQAGAAEIAGQWLLLTRREPYNPEAPGQHRLWLSIGGRVGQSSLHALDIEEGRRSDPGGRRWEVAVLPPEDIKRRAADGRQVEREAKRADELEVDRRAIVDALAAVKKPETKSKLRDRANVPGYRRYNAAFAALVQEGVLQPASVLNESNGQTYDGWGLRNDPE